MANIEQIKSVYAGRGVFLKAGTLDEIDAEVKKYNRFVNIPSLEQVLSGLEMADEHAQERAPLMADTYRGPNANAPEDAGRILNTIERGSTPQRLPHKNGRAQLSNIVKSFHFTTRRPEWIKGADTSTSLRGMDILFAGYGMAMIGPAYQRIKMRGLRPGDALVALAMADAHTPLGALLHLPPVDHGIRNIHRIFSNTTGIRKIVALADKKIVERFMGMRCPYALEMYHAAAAFMSLTIDRGSLTGALVIFDSRNDAAGCAHLASAQQLVCMSQAFGIPLHDIRVVAVPGEGVDAVYEPAGPQLTIGGTAMTPSEKSLSIGEIPATAASMPYAFGYLDDIPPDGLVVRHKLLPTAVGLWASNPAAFAVGIAEIQSAMNLPHQQMRMDALSTLYHAWRPQIVTLR